MTIRGNATTLETAFADMRTIHEEAGFAHQKLDDAASFDPFDEATLLGILADVESWAHSTLACASFIRARVAEKYVERLKKAYGSQLGATMGVSLTQTKDNS